MCLEFGLIAYSFALTSFFFYMDSEVETNRYVPMYTYKNLPLESAYRTSSLEKELHGLEN